MGEVFQKLAEEDRVKSFLDPFAGSGSVSRLARSLGFDVISGDWEFYSYIVNFAHIGMDARQGQELFKSRGGLKAVFEEINNFAYADTSADSPYISRYYAPRDTGKADFKKERLFYTRENGVFLDRVREKIEDWYPGWASIDVPVTWGGEAFSSTLTETDMMEKSILLASLLFQGATKANTSGVFKAFHKGFGGHGGDALSRILSPMKLEVPVMTDRGSGRVHWGGADETAASHSVDLCYLDPPYNIHQYGSNYHLLNTLALWDKIPVEMGIKSDGSLKAKAGIRQDWKRTKSPYCSPSSASRALTELLSVIDAKTIVLSYSTDGLIPFEELLDMLSSRGEVELHCREYVKYRGGKQSLGRQNYNIEFQWVVNTKSQSTQESRKRAQRFLLEYHLVNHFQGCYCPERLLKVFEIQGDELLWKTGSGFVLNFHHKHGYKLIDSPGRDVLQDLSQKDLLELQNHLTEAGCKDREEEAEILLSILKKPLSKKEQRFFTKQFLIALRKLAHKKTRTAFVRLLQTAEDEIKPGFSLLDTPVIDSFRLKLAELERIAHLRFDN